jgi:uncharacterized membrane protein
MRTFAQESETLIMAEDCYRERVVVMACAAFQSLCCLATVGLLFSFPPRDRSQTIALLATTQVCLLISFLNVTMLGAVGANSRVLSFAKSLVWIPGIAMAYVVLYCIAVWMRS